MGEEDFTNLLLEEGPVLRTGWWQTCIRDFAVLSVDWKKSVFPVRGGSPDSPLSYNLLALCLPRTRGFTSVRL